MDLFQYISDTSSSSSESEFNPTAKANRKLQQKVSNLFSDYNQETSREKSKRARIISGSESENGSNSESSNSEPKARIKTNFSDPDTSDENFIDDDDASETETELTDGVSGLPEDSQSQDSVSEMIESHYIRTQRQKLNLDQNKSVLSKYANQGGLEVLNKFSKNVILNFSDFKTLIEIFIKDTTGSHGPYFYLQKIHRPNHFKNHETENRILADLNLVVNDGLTATKSAAWNQRMVYLLENFSNLDTGPDGRDLDPKKLGKSYYTERCFACRKKNENLVDIKFFGENYDKKFYRPKKREKYEYDSGDSATDEENSGTETDSDSQIENSSATRTDSVDSLAEIVESSFEDIDKSQFKIVKMGSSCLIRLEVYHQLFHYLYKLHKKLVKFNLDPTAKKIKPGKKLRDHLLERISDRKMRHWYQKLRILLERSKNIEVELKRNRFKRSFEFGLTLRFGFSKFSALPAIKPRLITRTAMPENFKPIENPLMR